MDSVRSIFGGRRPTAIEKDRALQRPRGSMDGRGNDSTGGGGGGVPAFGKRRVSGTYVRTNRSGNANGLSSAVADDGGAYSQQIAEYYAARLKVMDEEVDEVRFERDEAIKELQARDRMLVRLQENLSMMETRIDGSFRNLDQGGSITAPLLSPRPSLVVPANGMSSNDVLPESTDNNIAGGNEENDPDRLATAQRHKMTSSRKSSLAGNQIGANLKLGGSELVDLQHVMQRRVLTIEATVERLRVERDAAFKKKERQQAVQVAGLQAKIASLDAARSQAAQEAQTAREQLALVQSQLRDLSAVHAVGQSESDGLSTKLRTMDESVQKLTKENEDALAIHRSLRTDLEAAEASLSAHQSMVHTSSSRVSELERERKDLADSLRSVQTQLHHARRLSITQTGGIQKNLDQEKKSSVTAKTKLEKRETEIKEVSRRLALVEKELRDEQKNNRDLQRQLDSHNRERQKLSKELEDHKKKHEVVTEKMTRQRMELQAAKSATEKERAALAQTVTQLERKLAAQEHALKDSEDSMKRTVAKMERGQKTLLKERESLLVKTTTLEGDLHSLQEANDGLQRKLEVEDTGETEIEAKLEEALLNIDSLNRDRYDDVERLEALNTALRAEYEVALDEIEAKMKASDAKKEWVDSELEKAGKDLWTATERSSVLERDLRDKEASLAEALEKLAQTEKEQEESKSALVCLQKKLETVQQAFDDSQHRHEEKLSSLSTREGELKRQLTSLESERILLHERIAFLESLQDGQRTLQEDMAEAVAEKSGLQSRVKELETTSAKKLSSLKHRVKQLEEYKADVEAEHETLIEALVREKKTRAAKIVSVEGANRTLEAQLEQMQASLDIEKSLVSESVSERNSLMADLNVMVEKETVLQGRSEVMTAEVKELRTQCEETQHELTSSRAKISELHSQCELLDSSKAGLQADIMRLEKALEASAKQYRMAEKARFEVTSELTVANDRSERLKRLVEEMRSKVGARENDIKILHTNHESVSRSLEEKKAKVVKVESDNLALKHTLKSKLEKIEELSEKVSSSKSKVDESILRENGLSERLGYVSSRAEKEASKRQLLAREKKELESRIELLSSANEALTLQEDKLKGMQAVLCPILTPGESEDSLSAAQITSYVNKMESNLLECSQKISRLEDIQGELTAAATSASKKIGTMETERGKMMAAIQKMKAATRNRSSALDQELEDMSQKNDELTVELHALRRNLSESEKVIEMKNVELSSTEGSLVDTRAQMASLDSDLKALVTRVKRTRRRRRGLFFLFQAPVMVSVTIGAFEAWNKMHQKRSSE